MNTNSKKRNKPAYRSTPYRPYLEYLEDRLPPAVFVPITGAKDLVLDETRNLLYVPTAQGTVERIDLSTYTPLAPYVFGTNLTAADITPANDSLYVTEAKPSTELLYKVDLTAGSISTIAYPPSYPEDGTYGIAIGSQGKGLVSTRSNSGTTAGVYLQELTIANDVLLPRPLPFYPPFDGTVGRNSQIKRSADRSTFIVSGSGSVSRYSAISDSFPIADHYDYNAAGQAMAVSPNGDFIAESDHNLWPSRVHVYDAQFNIVRTLSYPAYGLAFSPIQDILYIADAGRNELVAIDTQTGSRLSRFLIDEDLPYPLTNGPGTMITSSDGAYLYLMVPTGVQVLDLTEGPKLKIADFSLNNEGLTIATARVPVSITRIDSLPITTEFRTVDGTAVAMQDYIETTGTLTFTPADYSLIQEARIPVNRDISHVTEDFTVELSNPINAGFEDTSGTVSLVQSPKTWNPRFEVSPTSVVPDAVDVRLAEVFVFLYGAEPGKTYQVDFATVEESGEAGIDYVHQSGTLSFLPGESYKTIQISMLPAPYASTAKRFSIQLSNANAQLSSHNQSTLVYIEPNFSSVPVPEVTIADTTLWETDSYTDIVFTLTLSEPATNTVTVYVNFATDLPSFTNGSLPVTVGFSPGSTTRSVAFTNHGDIHHEPDDFLIVYLHLAVNALIADNLATAMILDDDPATISVATKQVEEAPDGLNEVRFTVTLASAVNDYVSFDYRTINVSAEAGTDYIATSGTIVFEPRQTSSQWIGVTLLHDLEAEDTEEFLIELSNPQNCNFDLDLVSITIYDDDTPFPTISGSPVTVTEGEANETFAVFTINLSEPDTRPIQVEYTTVDGTAAKGTDYVEQKGWIAFAPGETSKTIAISVIDDSTLEWPETFSLRLRIGNLAPALIPYTSDSEIPLITSNATLYRDSVYFHGYTAAFGAELWRFDGNQLTLVADIAPGSVSSSPHNLVVLNDKLLFAANDGITGYELWMYDGTQVSQLKDIRVGADSSTPDGFTVYRDWLYFIASTPGSYLYRTNGTITTKLTDAYDILGIANDKLTLVKYNDPYETEELVVYDGTRYTWTGIRTGPYDALSSISASYADALYFGWDIFPIGGGLMQFNGTTVNRVALPMPLGYISTDILIFGTFQDRLLFSARDVSHGYELWTFDGSNASMLLDLNTGPLSSPIWAPFIMTSAFYFFANDGADPKTLMRFNGLRFQRIGTETSLEISAARFAFDYNSDIFIGGIDNGEYRILILPGVCNDYDLELISTIIDNEVPYLTLQPPSAVQYDESGGLVDLGAFTDLRGSTWSVHVDFGDGSSPITFAVNAQGQILYSHTFPDDGQFLVDLAITNDTGDTINVSFTVIVVNVAPSVAYTTSSGLISGRPGELTIGVHDESEVDRNSAFSVTVDWGDGSPIETFIGLNPLRAGHEFGTPGTKSVVVTATDKDGGQGNPLQVPLVVGDVAFEGSYIAIGGTSGDDDYDVSWEDQGRKWIIDRNGANIGMLAKPAIGFLFFASTGTDHFTLSGSSDFDSFAVDLPTISTLGVSFQFENVETYTVNGFEGGSTCFYWSGDNVTVNGGGGFDQLIVIADGNTSLSDSAVTLSNGNILNFASFDSARIDGGVGDDTFDITGWSGFISLNGFDGTDTITLTEDADYYLSNAVLTTSAGRDVSHVQIERAELAGGSSNNTFTVSGWTGSGIIAGAAGTDTIIAVNNKDFTLGNSTLARSSFGTLTLAGIEAAKLTGGGGNNTFQVNGWTGMATLTGAAGTDVVTSQNDANFTPGNSSMTRSTGGTFALIGIEEAKLTGGAGNTSFTVSNWTRNATLDGAGGTDKVISVNDAHFDLAGSPLTRSNGGSFALLGIEQAAVTGGVGDNSFTISNWLGTATISGSGGNDTVISVNDSNFTLTNSSLSRSTGGAFTLSSIEKSQLTGGSSDNTFTVSNWTGQATLDGGAGNDKIISTNDADLTLSDTLLTRSTSGSFQLTSIESANLIGGGASNVLNAAAFTGKVTLNGLAGDDVLVGGSGDDSLVGANGRDLLIGRGGLDTLVGGNDDDILIGGSTDHDQNRPALDALMAEWRRTDLVGTSQQKYQQRIDHLFGTTAGGNNGGTLLTANTVHDDGADDVLTGGGQLDWFFQSLGDTISDLNLGGLEIVTMV